MARSSSNNAIISGVVGKAQWVPDDVDGLAVPCDEMDANEPTAVGRCKSGILANRSVSTGGDGVGSGVGNLFKRKPYILKRNHK